MSIFPGSLTIEWDSGTFLSWLLLHPGIGSAVYGTQQAVMSVCGSIA